MAYLKERPRKRAAKQRLKDQTERTEKLLANEREWKRRFEQIGSGQKRKVLPLAEGALAGEVEATPFSRRARSAVL